MRKKSIEELMNNNGFIIHQIEHKIKIKHDSNLEKYGVTLQQSKIIAHLLLNKNLDTFQKDIEKAFNLKSSTITSILNTLENKELIKRIDIKEDRRAKKIVLTENGENLQKNVFKSMDDIEEELVKGMTENEKDMLHKLLLMVYRNI
ncbi:MAG: MarR family transcriptional regulator [Clostridium perfringens]|nr:MarR family transcriptional regulator [Clostridium perfringens]